jgi:hypothetical protein
MTEAPSPEDWNGPYRWEELCRILHAVRLFPDDGKPRGNAYAFRKKLDEAVERGDMLHRKEGNASLWWISRAPSLPTEEEATSE